MQAGARILYFPAQTAPLTLSLAEAELAARDFLAVPAEERSEDHRQRYLFSPDILLAICTALKERRDLQPANVLKDVGDIYQWISRPDCDLGLFDEKDYFIGETALLAGTVSRYLGDREKAFLWLDRAEAGFRHTMNPAPGLANVAYARLALRFEMGRYEDVMELTPSLEGSFSKLKMGVEAAKCTLLMAMTLKQTGQNEKAVDLLEQLSGTAALKSDIYLHSRVLSELGDLRQLQGQQDLAMSAFQKALALLANEEVCVARADLKLYVGGLQKALGFRSAAIEAFREARNEYRALDRRTLVAYTHLVIAETLLEMAREREAEWEILTALPAIEELKMVPEGFAAVALLRESARAGSTDTKALQLVRARLQG